MYQPSLRVLCACTLLLLSACGGGGGGGGPALDLVAVLAAPVSVVPGASYTYTVTGTATGGTVQSVGVTLTLPATVAIGAITGGGMASGNAVTWPTTASLVPGTLLSYTVAVTASSIGPLDATLQLTTTSSENTANNSATRSTVLGFTILATLIGENPGDNFGFVADTVGDITGDGRPDFISTSPFNDVPSTDVGRAYVYSGANAALLYTVIGTAGENFGWSAAAAGDVDGDGTGDFIVGGPGTGNGVARVYSGDDGTLIRTLTGPSAGSRFGVAVASLGDINADGRADLLVGAEDAATTGQALVISGIDGATLRTHTGPSGPNFGQGVAGLGDVSGDAVPDYAIGGGFLTGGYVEVHSGASGALLYTVTPLAGASAFGFIWIDSVGDVDGDSRPDFFAADTDADGHRGRGYLISGATGTIIRTHVGDGSPEQFGIARHGGFDVDGDAVPDLFISGYHSSEGANVAGKSYVYSGATGALLRTMTTTIAGRALGYDGVQLGDVDGDGLVDYILTGGQEVAPGNGVLFVIRGTALP